MGLYNFQKRFAPFILSGRKSHTIRAIRANPDKPGNTLHLYTGLRCKTTRLLMRVPCTKVEEILISDPRAVSIDGVALDLSEREQLARRDGFKDFADMMQFWAGRLPFRGHIIHWKATACGICPQCEGAGIFNSTVCTKCDGHGSCAHGE
jgi:hypothetical protein